MAKHLTPIVGLAVVVALALAAVFGSMSLANPALAAIGQPADAELTERTVSPQGTMDDPIMMYLGIDSDPYTVFSTLPTGAAAVGASAYDPTGIIEGDVDYTTGADRGKVTFTTVGAATNNDISLGGSLVKATFVSDNGTTAAPPTPPTDDDVEVEVYIRVMRSNAAGAAMEDGSPVTALDDEELFTSFTTEGVDVGQAFESGTGTGEIHGYNVIVTGGAAPTVAANGFNVTDDLPGTAADSLALAANVGAEGLADLTGGSGVVTTAVELSVSPICQTSKDVYGTCAGVSAVTLDVTVANSTAATASGTAIPAATVTIGSPLMVDASDVTPAFSPGMGTGSVISNYQAVSSSPFHFFAVASMDGSIVINGVNVGSGLVTVTAIDGFDPNNNPMAAFAVTVVEPDAPLPMASDLSFMVEDTTAEGAAMDMGEVTLSWTNPNDSRITGWQYSADGGTTWMDITIPAGETAGTINSVSMTVDVGSSQSFQLRYMLADGMTGGETPASPALVVTVPVPPPPFADSFVQSSDDPGDSANFTATFQIRDSDDASDLVINTRQNDLVVEFHEDYGMPASIRTTSVAITTEGGMYQTRGGGYTNTRTFTPEDVTVDGEKVLISLGDMDEQDDSFDYEIEEGEIVTVHFRQSAGITTATEQGGYFLVEVAFGDFSVAYNEDTEKPKGFEVNVYRKISLSEEDGGLGDVITATGKGYKNGTTLTVFVDTLSDHDDDPTTPLVAGQDGRLNLGEDVLCVANIGSDDVGKCDFTVSHPVFVGGMNYVNAVDGRNQYARKSDTFDLTASVQARPASGSPGESIVLQIVDFPTNRGISAIQISRDPRTINCVGNCSTDQNGAASFSIIIPNWVKGGTQDLRVGVDDAKGDRVWAGTTVALAGPRVVSTPQTVVANQRISLVGTGFSPNAELGDDTPESRAISRVSIGGYPIPWPKVNDGRNVSVDDSGNWSASLDLPLVEATTGTGDRLLRITDSFGRTGVIILNLAERDFDVTPPSGRVGTLAVVRGVGYPGKNDEGDSFTIDVTYKVQEGTETRVSVVPDASGRFEVQLRIPTTAPIPSTNQVEVTFEHEVGGTKVTDVKQHSIPEGLISTSETSGGPGTTVTLMGEGFKTFAPIEGVKIGAIDITPAPRPHTDANGMLSFDILIPGLDVGIQTIEVRVGGTTSSVGFTVTESGVNPGDIKPVAEATEELGDNLVSVWNFNNDTKVWAFYDPALDEGNTLTHMITGETYLIRIKADQEVILNRDTRNLTCVGGNCWNQVVW